MKKVIALVLSMTATISGFAQTAVEKSFWDDPVNHPMMPLYLITSFVFIVIVLLMTVMLMLLRVLRMMVTQAEKERALKSGVPYIPSPSFFAKLTRTLNNSVPLEKEQDIDLGHDFDGIRELDNHLPPWWKWLFAGTVGWGAVYLVVFHISSSLPLSHEEYDNEIAAAEVQKRKLEALQPQATIDVNTLEYKADATIIARGEKTFSNNCISCHRKDGGGNSIGPNLTDHYWLHGNGIKNIYNTINHGFVEKGMPAWGKALSPTEVRDVAFFVMSLQGSNPPNAKGPQGVLENVPAIQQSDSLKTSASL